MIDIDVPVTGKNEPLLVDMAGLCRMSNISRATGWRLYKAGALPTPCIQAGRVLRWGVAAVEKWASVEGGRMKTQAFTPDRCEALAQILRLLDLEGEPLSISGKWALLNHFHSVPYDHRKDGSLLAGHLELVLLGIKAADRAESLDTVKNSPGLTQTLREIQGAAGRLAGA